MTVNFLGNFLLEKNGFFISTLSKLPLLKSLEKRIEFLI